MVVCVGESGQCDQAIACRRAGAKLRNAALLAVNRDAYAVLYR
jgi:hypothetical protein